MLKSKRELLLKTYYKWELELKDVCPELINEAFSYPYYLHIPDDWFDKKYRVLIVGEEGYGNKVYNTPIEEVQKFNRDYLEKQLGPNRDNNSSFWRRIRRISSIFKPTEFSMTWTNLDKIHHSGRGNCRLKKHERFALHRTSTHILREEIKLLQPTHVIYFGWYGDSLKEELQYELLSVFNTLYPKGLGDYSGWQSEKIRVIKESGIYHIFTYHPGWGQRQKDGYERRVIDVIKQTL